MSAPTPAASAAKPSTSTIDTLKAEAAGAITVLLPTIRVTVRAWDNTCRIHKVRKICACAAQVEILTPHECELAKRNRFVPLLLSFLLHQASTSHYTGDQAGHAGFVREHGQTPRKLT